MGQHLADLPSNKEDLLTVGAIHASDVQTRCVDLAAMIFPSAINPPTEACISAVTIKLVNVVSDIEAALLKNTKSVVSDLPSTWSLLAKSGFLREHDLIDFMLARVAEDRLDAKLTGPNHQLPAELLAHSNAGIAKAAQRLLAADSLNRRSPGTSYHALRPELLHQLCWRLVAAIEVERGSRNDEVIASAQTLLAEYDEGLTAQVAARKLLHFLDGGRDADLSHPDKAGLQLYVAQLANVLGIDQDHVVLLMDSTSAAPFSIMLRGAGNDAHQAMAAIYRFNGFSLTPRDVGLFEDGFERLDPQEARSTVSKWASARAKYLIFPPSMMSGA